MEIVSIYNWNYYKLFHDLCVWLVMQLTIHIATEESQLVHLQHCDCGSVANI